MIYLIGGVPRSGKTMLAKRLSQETGIAYINFDDVTQVFQDIVPKYGLKNEMDQDQRESLAFPIVKSLIELYLWREESVIIEGDNFDIARFIEYKKISKGELKMAVLGYSNLTPNEKIEINKNSPNVGRCWFEDVPQDQKPKIAQEMIDWSKKRKNIVESIGDKDLIYLDTHDNFEKSLQFALEFLIKS